MEGVLIFLFAAAGAAATRSLAGGIAAALLGVALIPGINATISAVLAGADGARELEEIREATRRAVYALLAAAVVLAAMVRRRA